VFGSERLTGALLDRLTHHVHILELNGDSYRLRQSKGRRAVTAAAASAPAKALAARPKPEANGDGNPSAD
jgi:IstB-like ATP binding protein